MKRVAIIGSGGAGKTTLAKALSSQTGLPAVHLDRLYWQPGWVATPPVLWQERQRTLLEQKAWIIDGNYGSTLGLRLEAADTVVFLDTPRRHCLWRVLKRRLRYAGCSRPDMTEGCPERLTGEFLRWIWHYPDRHRPLILQTLARLENRRVVHLKNRREIEAFLEASKRA